MVPQDDMSTVHGSQQPEEEHGGKRQDESLAEAARSSAPAELPESRAVFSEQADASEASVVAAGDAAKAGIDSGAELGASQLGEVTRHVAALESRALRFQERAEHAEAGSRFLQARITRTEHERGKAEQAAERLRHEVERLHAELATFASGDRVCTALDRSKAQVEARALAEQSCEARAEELEAMLTEEKERGDRLAEKLMQVTARAADDHEELQKERQRTEDLEQELLEVHRGSAEPGRKRQLEDVRRLLSSRLAVEAVPRRACGESPSALNAAGSSLERLLPPSGGDVVVEDEVAALHALLESSQSQCADLRAELARLKENNRSLQNTQNSFFSSTQASDLHRSQTEMHHTMGQTWQKITSDMQEQLSATEGQLGLAREQKSRAERQRDMAEQKLDAEKQCKEEAEGLVHALEQEIRALETTVREQQQHDAGIGFDVNQANIAAVPAPSSQPPQASEAMRAPTKLLGLSGSRMTDLAGWPRTPTCPLQMTLDDCQGKTTQLKHEDVDNDAEKSDSWGESPSPLKEVCQIGSALDWHGWAPQAPVALEEPELEPSEQFVTCCGHEQRALEHSPQFPSCAPDGTRIMWTRGSSRTWDGLGPPEGDLLRGVLVTRGSIMSGVSPASPTHQLSSAMSDLRFEAPSPLASAGASPDQIPRKEELESWRSLVIENGALLEANQKIRLLLDEMTSRLQRMRRGAEARGPAKAAMLADLAAAAGLGEVFGKPPRNVFERLYWDALLRLRKLEEVTRKIHEKERHEMLRAAADADADEGAKVDGRAQPRLAAQTRAVLASFDIRPESRLGLLSPPATAPSCLAAVFEQAGASLAGSASLPVLAAPSVSLLQASMCEPEHLMPGTMPSLALVGAGPSRGRAQPQSCSAKRRSVSAAGACDSDPERQCQSPCSPGARAWGGAWRWAETATPSPALGSTLARCPSSKRKTVSSCSAWGARAGRPAQPLPAMRAATVRTTFGGGYFSQIRHPRGPTWK